MPDELRQQILDFGATIAELREASAEPFSAAPMERAMPMLQLAPSEPIQALYFLSNEEREVLASADPESEVFQQVAGRTIEAQIIQPAFEELE
jgi:hypothetical protein